VFVSNSTLPAKPKRRRGVVKVHPNSAASRIWGRSTWEYRD